LEKNRDVTFLTEGCDTRGGGAVVSCGIGVVVLNGRATASARTDRVGDEGRRGAYRRRRERLVLWDGHEAIVA